MGGGDVIRQALDEGLLDELILHIAPMVLGDGAPLFDGAQRRELEQVSVEVSPYASHVTYKVPAIGREALAADLVERARVDDPSRHRRVDVAEPEDLAGLGRRPVGDRELDPVAWRSARTRSGRSTSGHPSRTTSAVARLAGQAAHGAHELATDAAGLVGGRDGQRRQHRELPHAGRECGAPRSLTITWPTTSPSRSATSASGARYPSDARMRSTSRASAGDPKAAATTEAMASWSSRPFRRGW